MRDYYKTNKKRWDELAGIHYRSKDYDVKGFMKGRSSLHSIELDALGSVKGKSLLHLQCHFGLDTLSLARLGAIVTGVDFSDASIKLAQDLSVKSEIPARFVACNIYDLPKKLDGRFDIVFTSYGVLAWLPDLTKWGNIVAKYLKSGGIFVIAEFHPFSWIFDNENIENLDYRSSYFHQEIPYYFESDLTYVETDEKVTNLGEYAWQHTLSDIVNAIIDSGLELVNLSEYPYSVDKIYPNMKQGRDGYYRFRNKNWNIPLMFLLKAIKNG